MHPDVRFPIRSARGPVTALRATLLPVLFAVAAACAGTAGSTVSPAPCPAGEAWPAAEWERLPAPECAGWSAEGLEGVRERLSGLTTTAFMAVVDGRVLMEYGDPAAVSYLASVRKSVLSMLYGIYVDSGIVDLDATLEELGIDDNQGLTTREKQARVRDLLAARSGIYHPASNAGDDLGSAPPRGSQPPGTYYLYSNWDFNALGTIFEQVTGRDLYDALEQHLARPLGFRDFDRSMHRRTGNAERSRHLAYHMHLSTRDMARIGLLMERDGRWRADQIVPADWVRESTRAITPRTEMNPVRRRDGPFGYGYLWWVFDTPDLRPEYVGAYTGLGAVGQHILVMPALDLVVVHKTRPGEGQGVSHGQFLEVVEALLEARCAEACVPAGA